MSQYVKVKLLFCCIFFLQFFALQQAAFAQAPNIGYLTPPVYRVNQPIPNLAPGNTGGAVPATLYSQVTTYAGTGVQGATNGPALGASFYNPTRSALDAAGNLYVCDRDNLSIRKISPAGIVTTVTTGIEQLNGITVDGTGNIYVTAASANSIKKIMPQGTVSTVAGNGSPSFYDGTGTNSGFYYPYTVIIGADGNLYVADSYNNAIRKVTPQGVVTTIAGTGSAGAANGNAATATFNHPGNIAFDGAGNIYIADGGNNLIRKLSATGQVSTYGGTQAAGVANGPATSASFDRPAGVTVDAAGNVYVADMNNNMIRKITPAGVVTSLAGNGSPGAVNGLGDAASFNRPNDVQWDGKGNLYVTDYQNNLIRKICITGYTIDKALPPGLTFDSTTGIISGTPTAVSPPTIYTITAYNAAGSSTTSVNIQVQNVSTLIFPALPVKAVCDADFTPGATSTVGPVSYTSSNPAVATIVGNQIHLISIGTAIITATDNTSSEVQILTVVSGTAPLVNIVAKPTSACQGMPITFTANVGNPGSSTPLYQWMINDVNVGTSTATITFNNLTPTDRIECHVTSSGSCGSVGISNVITGLVIDPYVTPAVSITSSASGSICSGTPVTFTAQYSNGGTNPAFQWQVNGTNAGTNQATFTSSTLANGDVVTCVLTNTGGACLTSNTVTSNPITTNVTSPTSPAPAIAVSASADHVVEGTALTFMATVSNAASVTSYQWYVNEEAVGNDGPTFSTSALKINDKVTCTVTLVAGCTLAITSPAYQANFITPADLHIPNTFTPNGDGVNDTWKLTDLNYYPGSLVTIYNRYGTILYQSKGYTRPWDGTWNNKPLPAATYYYVIDLSQNKRHISGYITILR